jgi:hypothetical protein
MNRSIFTMPDRLSFSTYNSFPRAVERRAIFISIVVGLPHVLSHRSDVLPNSYFRFLFTSMFFGIAVHPLEARLLTKSYEDFRYPQTTIPQQR